MFVISKKFGIGEIIEESEQFFTVDFEEARGNKNILKSIAKTFHTEDDAEIALDTLLVSNEEPRLTEEEILSGLKNFSDLAETNRENAMKNLPSSMR